MFVYSQLLLLTLGAIRGYGYPEFQEDPGPFDCLHPFATFTVFCRWGEWTSCSRCLEIR